jgi:hypothetical protein
MGSGLQKGRFFSKGRTLFDKIYVDVASLVPGTKRLEFGMRRIFHRLILTLSGVTDMLQEQGGKNHANRS